MLLVMFMLNVGVFLEKTFFLCANESSVQEKTSENKEEAQDKTVDPVKDSINQDGYENIAKEANHVLDKEALHVKRTDAAYLEDSSAAHAKKGEEQENNVHAVQNSLESFRDEHPM